MSLDRSHGSLVVPDLLRTETVDAASAEHARLLAMYRETDAELRQATAARNTAADSDRRAYAEALASGRKDPGSKHVEKADEALAQIERKRDALELAIPEAHAAVTEAVLDDREALTENADREVQDAEHAYREAIDGLARAHHALSSAVGARTWLRRFPDQAAPKAALRLVSDLPQRNGDPYDAQTVIAALRQLGDLPDHIVDGDGTMPPGFRIVEA